MIKIARPTKQGVDYFPLDVHLDNKFKFIEIKFGLEGFAVVIKLLQEIYAQGYFCKWGEDEKLLFSNEHNVDINQLEGITNECIKRSIFDKGMYEKYSIMTSTGIQKRYKEIVRRRKDVDVTEEYLLIDNSFGVNDDIVTTSSKHDECKSTQSKVKESKVNKSKENRKRVYDESSIYYTLSKRLYDRILENNPNHKKPNLQTWANDVRLMIERDNRTEKQITYLIDWCQSNDFWKSNILSISKLREKFDQLVMQIKSNKEKVIEIPKYEVNDDATSNDKHSEESGNVRLFR